MYLDIANDFHKHPNFFYRLFERDSLPKSDFLKELADKYNVNINYILTGKGQKYITETEEEVLSRKLESASYFV